MTQLTRRQEHYLLKAYDAVSVAVCWWAGGEPVRNLAHAGLTFTKLIPGPYPSSHPQHHWTYRLTGAVAPRPCAC